jgi:hypothetical protein
VFRVIGEPIRHSARQYRVVGEFVSALEKLGTHFRYVVPFIDTADDVTGYSS